MRRRLVIVTPAVLAVALIAGCSSSSSTTSGAASPSITATTPNFSSSASSSSAPSSTSPAATTSASGGELASLTATQILAKTKAATVAAKSVKVAGKVIESGASTSIDLAFAENGTEGSVTTKGFKIDIIALKNVVYFKAPDAFFTSTLGAKAPAVLAKISGKWVKGAATDSNFASFSALADKSKFFTSTLDNASALTKAGEKNVAGVDCLALKDDSGTLYVAADDARPIELVGGGTDGSGKLDFTEYGKVPAAIAPPAAQTVDSSALGS